MSTRPGKNRSLPGDNLGVVAAQVEIPLEVGTRRYLYGQYFLGNSDESRPGLVLSGRGPAWLWLSGGLQASEISTTITEGEVSLRLDADPLQSAEPPPYYPETSRMRLVHWHEQFLD